jgi:hypothetical protein
VDGDIEGARELIERFIQSLNQFYSDADVGGFLDRNRVVFDGAEKEVEANLPPEGFIDSMESYYGEEKAGYRLIPSPLFYDGIGFGQQVATTDGTIVLNVFGAVASPDTVNGTTFGFDDADEIRRLSVHEFGHSFVNPLVDLPENRQRLPRSEHLHEAVRDRMAGLGYRTWEVIVKEYLVRLGEIRIALAMGDPELAEELREYHVNHRGFIYLPALEQIVESYEENRDRFPSFRTFLPTLLGALAEIDQLEVS